MHAMSSEGRTLLDHSLSDENIIMKPRTNTADRSATEIKVHFQFQKISCTTSYFQVDFL